MCYFQEFSNGALSNDQVTESQALAIVEDKRNALCLSQGHVSTEPVIRQVTQDGCLPECDSSLSVPVPTFIAFEDDTPVGFISSPVLYSPSVPCGG